MCIVRNCVTGQRRYNWDGDRIIHDTVVPSARPIVGIPGYHEYSIDIREYLITEKNAAISAYIYKDIRQYIESIPIGDWAYFISHDEGSFDYRAFLINSYLSSNLKYALRGIGKPWLFPDETITLGYGDCEDIAFLQASLMISSGISNYNVRVALGKILVTHENGKKKTIDHTWVMYKNEGGVWRIIEPLLHKKTFQGKGTQKQIKTLKKTSEIRSIEYIPYFLFNDQHLWRDRNSSHNLLEKYLGERSKHRLNPTFAGEAHQTIIHAAFDGLPNSFEWFKHYMDSQFLFGVTIPLTKIKIPVVDKKDFDYGDFKLFPYPQLAYDPLDHFDNGYVKESYAKVLDNLNAFKGDPKNNIDSFAKAAHAIADFYAHTTYSAFAKRQQINGKNYFSTFKPDVVLGHSIDYSSGAFDLKSDKFSTNLKLWNGPKNQIPPIWRDKLISGRYSQHGDWHNAAERFSTTVSPLEDESQTQFNNRGSLPHHNEIAVDGDNQYVNKTTGNQVYQNPQDYQHELAIRENTAIVHIQQAFYQYYSGDKVELQQWWNTVPKI
jgi:hypothetical protein